MTRATKIWLIVGMIRKISQSYPILFKKVIINNNSLIFLQITIERKRPEQIPLLYTSKNVILNELSRLISSIIARPTGTVLTPIKR